MSSIFGILNLGASALRTNQRDLATTGDNIANAQTPGYTRQSAQRQAVEGGGVELGVIERLRDAFVEREYMAGREGSAYASARSAWASQIERPFDETDTSGVGDALGELYNSFRDLATTPQDPAARARVRSAAGQLGTAFKRASTALSAAADGIDASLKADTAEVNSLAQRIAGLNASIQRAESANGAPSNSLRDQRDEAVRSLVEKTGGQALENGSQVTVLVAGRLLVDGDRAGSMSLANDAAGARLRLTDPSGTSDDVTGKVTRGSMGAALEVRDRTLADLKGRLDQLAYDVASRVNEVHRAGYGKDGRTGRDLFTQPTQVSGAASSLALSSAVLASTDAIAASQDAATAGDNRNALALAAVGDEARAALGGERAGAFYARMASDAGRVSADATGQKAAEEARMQQAEALRSNVSGVSVDEEMTQVLKLQASFQASAKVITAADEMLQNLLKLM